MKKWSKICVTIGLLFVVSTPLIPSYVLGWRQTTSDIQEFPDFTTHQWLAFEARQLSPSTSMLQWITNNRLAFWHGVEAPHNAEAASPYDVNYTDNYGDISDLVLYLDVTGTTVTEGNLSDRAQEEYDKLVVELAKNDVDHELAAFYAGAMTHYVSQAGTYATVWNETLWGALNNANWTSYERFIDDTLDANSFRDDESEYISDVFTLAPTVITPVDAENAAIDLAQAIHPIAQTLQSTFNQSSTSVDDWSIAYKDLVTDCLTYSVEAIYASIKHALESVNWKTITIENPDYTVNTTTGIVNIPEFSVYYTDNTGKHNLTWDNATVAEYRILVDPEGDEPTYQPETKDLLYNSIVDKWYLTDHLIQGAVANEDHMLVFFFKMNGSTLTHSNDTNIFSITFFEVEFNNFRVSYNPTERTVSVRNISCSLPDVPTVGVIEDTEVSSAKWFLYTKGQGVQTGEAIGVLAYDTEGSQPNGDLEFNATDNTWYSLDNDIGLVFTATLQQYYILVRFDVTGLPVGYFKESSSGAGDEFVPYAQASDDYFFETRDHIITQTKPELVFDEENLLVSISGVRAWADYENTSLDYYEIVQKPIFGGEDRRQAKWKIFLYDGIASSITGNLLWDDVNEYWYYDDMDVSSLPDNDFYVATKITNMNVNSTVSPWGPSSDMFSVSRPVPVVYFILPEIFLAGFIVLFGWLVWYRPMMKKRRIQRERDEKLDKGYMD